MLNNQYAQAKNNISDLSYIVVRLLILQTYMRTYTHIMHTHKRKFITRITVKHISEARAVARWRRLGDEEVKVK